MNNKWAAVLVVVLVIVGALFLFKNKSAAPTDGLIENAMPAGDSSVEEMTVEEQAVSSQPQAPTPTSSSPTPASNQASTVKEFTIDNDRLSFKPATLTVNKGDTVKITFRNTGGTHDLRIDEFSGAATKILSAGQTETITFVADKAGSFEYYCSVGSHRAQGMWGTLTVR